MIVKRLQSQYKSHLSQYLIQFSQQDGVHFNNHGVAGRLFSEAWAKFQPGDPERSGGEEHEEPKAKKKQRLRWGGSKNAQPGDDGQEVEAAEARVGDGEGQR